MEFGLDKCIRAIVKHVTLTTSQNISLNSHTAIRNMKLDDLGAAEGEGMDKQMKDKLVKENYCQVWQILNTVKLEKHDHSCHTTTTTTTIIIITTILLLLYIINTVISSDEGHIVARNM
jgi:hypothetical protein